MDTASFENTLQNALRTLNASLQQHERRNNGYERTLERLNELRKSVPPESRLPLGEIVAILRRTLAVEDFPILLTLDLRMSLSLNQTIGIIEKDKATIESQMKEIHKEVAKAEELSILRATEKEVLNEEGLPIKDIREDIFDEEEIRRGVPVAEEEPTKIYTMEEIDRIMDDAMIEEKAELEALRKKEAEERNRKSSETEKGLITAVAGEGLEVGQVSGEELLAKLMDHSKERYNPIDDTWIGDENEEEETDEEYGSQEDEDEEEEEDQYGRTRGFLIPPHLAQGTIQNRGVKFASFEKPATPSAGTIDKPVKSALKKRGIPSAPDPPKSEQAIPIKSTETESVMSVNVVERKSSRPNTQKEDTKVTRQISRFKAARQGIQ